MTDNKTKTDDAMTVEQPPVDPTEQYMADIEHLTNEEV